MKHRLFICAGIIAAVVVPFSAAAQSGGLTVELNKLQQDTGTDCRAFFLFHNDLEQTLEGFEMSLAILDQQGVIDQLLTVDASPVPIARTTLKLFDFPDIACADISEILLHDITTCRPQNGEEMNCFDLLTLESKSRATLVK